MRNKRILITGATGFIGSNLAGYFLKKNANVFIFTRKTSNKWRIKGLLGNVSEHQIDLLDENGLEKAVRKIKPEIIFHTSVYGAYPYQNDAKKIIEVNFTGTINLLNACLKKGFEIFVNTGSSSEYGVKNKPMKESDSLEPLSEYSASKAAAALFCQAVARKKNVTAVTLRLFSPYGYFEEQDRLVPSLILACIKSKNPKLSSPDSPRDFIFIEDVLKAYEKVVDNKDKVKAEIFNIGSGKQHTVGEVADKVIKLTGSKVKPKWGAVPNPRHEPLRWEANIQKAKRILGWKPVCTLQEGLLKDIKWHKERFMEGVVS
ncbi:MAG: NAD(P)-dependent oxidoreductase [Candidatus Omnitrophica bacterium]|nr:NAD(P)-dependent oxidoreductase [Candidatus Omnitrophota bacterium]